MTDRAQTKRHCRLAFAVGTSVLAWGTGAASHAQAQCYGNLNTADGSTTCTVSDSYAIKLNNIGTIGTPSQSEPVDLSGRVVTVTNSGTIFSDTVPVEHYRGIYAPNQTVFIDAEGGLSVTNTGRIGNDGLFARNHGRALDMPISVTFANSGSIVGKGVAAVDLESTLGGAVMVTNSGTLSGQGIAGTIQPYISSYERITGAANGLYVYLTANVDPLRFSISNTGTISANAVVSAYGTAGRAIALQIFAYGSNTDADAGIIDNAATGTIAAAGPGDAYAIMVMANAPLTLNNAGRISASGGSSSVAIQTAGTYANTIRNTGTIIGDINLADGADTVDNAGTIAGSVSLGAGDDTFIQRIGGTVSGLVDGGAGTNSYVVDSTGGTTSLSPAAITNFARVTQTGTGVGVISGNFGVDTLYLAGGTLAVQAGRVLATTGATTITGVQGSGDLMVVNAGTIAGGIKLADGNDTLTLLTGSRTFDTLDGGAGNDSLVLDGMGTGTLGSNQVANIEAGIKQGSGNWTLSGSTAASPTNWTIGAGTLTVAGGDALADRASVAIANGATLNLGSSETIGSLSGEGSVALRAGDLVTGGNNTDTTFAGVITDTGSLTKTGTGSLNLTGTNTYSGVTTVNAGRLAVNGSITSPVKVNAGATLGGNGTVGSVTVNAGGTFAPGNSIGTTNVAGGVTFATGSIYQVEANAAGMADRINAAGAVTINGGTVRVLAVPGTYSPLTNYTIITAGGGVNGRFAGVTSSLAFLTPFLTYSGSAVTLGLARNDISFASQASSPSGLAVAAAIQTRGLGDPIYNAILVQTAAGAGTAFNQLSGEIHATVPTVVIDSDRRVRDAIMDRTRVAPHDGLGVWMQSMDTQAYSRNQGDAANVRTDRTGIYGGLDYEVAGFRVGISGGHFDDKLRDPGVYSRADIETELVGASLGYAALHGRLTLDGGVTHGWHHAETTRTVTAVAALNGSYLSRATMQTTQLFGEAAFRLLNGPVTLTPFATIARDWLLADAFAESGGVTALTVAQSRRQITSGSAGVRLVGSYPVGSGGWTLQPYLSLDYLRNWGKLSAQRAEAFGLIGPAFTVVGDRLGRDSVDASGGLDLLAGANVRVGLSGYTARSSQWRDFGGKASVGVRF